MGLMIGGVEYHRDVGFTRRVLGCESQGEKVGADASICGSPGIKRNRGGKKGTTVAGCSWSSSFGGKAKVCVGNCVGSKSLEGKM